MSPMLPQDLHNAESPVEGLRGDYSEMMARHYRHRFCSPAKCVFNFDARHRTELIRSEASILQESCRRFDDEIVRFIV